jgi:hypothetical protein
LKGGGDVRSRVQSAASACLVASGLFLCGLGGALAIAQPSSPAEIGGGTHSDEVKGKGPKADADGSGGSAVSPGEKSEAGDSGATDTDKPGKGENPNNGNCGQGNDGSNGNAQGCGGGGSTPPSSPPSSPPPPSTTASTGSSTETTTSESTTTHTTSSTKTTTTSTETTSTTTSSVGLPAPGGGGGGGGGAVEVPSGIPELPPEMQLPPPAAEPSVVDVVPGVGAAAVDLPVPPITLPVIVAPMGAGGGGGAPGEPALPGTPRGVSAEPPAGREPLPANVGSNAAVPASSYRIGYTDYLRSAGLSQVAALAVPGVAGMLVLTGAGGLVGYRQAKAGHAVHTNGTARFVN